MHGSYFLFLTQEGRRTLEGIGRVVREHSQELLRALRDQVREKHASLCCGSQMTRV
jgi:hypothetical protein